MKADVADNRIPFLDASRFLAFIPVFLHHAFFSTSDLVLTHPIFAWIKHHTQWGVLGLDYFFVLSAFLITRLALLEHRDTGTFHFALFFVRRALRIWPLYFGVVLLGFVILWWKGPVIHSLPPWYWWTTFTANLYMAEHGIEFLFFLTILWSVCVEEQFYIVWGMFLRMANWLLVPAALFILFVSLIFRFTCHDEDYQVYFHSLSVAGNFAVGALAAAFVHVQKHVKINRTVFMVAILLFILGIAFYEQVFGHPVAFTFERLYFALIFAVWIVYMGFVYNVKETGSVSSSFLQGLGKRSLGLYIFHGIVITFFLHLDQIYGLNDSLFMALVITPITCLLLSVLLAELSYRFFEGPFIRWKESFYPDQQ